METRNRLGSALNTSFFFGTHLDSGDGGILGNLQGLDGL